MSLCGSLDFIKPFSQNVMSRYAAFMSQFKLKSLLGPAWLSGKVWDMMTVRSLVQASLDPLGFYQSVLVEDL